MVDFLFSGGCLYLVCDCGLFGELLCCLLGFVGLVCADCGVLFGLWLFVVYACGAFVCVVAPWLFTLHVVGVLI